MFTKKKEEILPSAPIDENDYIDVDIYNDIPLIKFFNNKIIENYYKTYFL